MKQKSIYNRIRTHLFITAAVAVIMGLISVVSIIVMRQSVISSGRRFAQTAVQDGTIALENQIISDLGLFVENKAVIVDEKMMSVARMLNGVASTATEIAQNPERYLPREVNYPNPANGGVTISQLALAEGVEYESVAGEVELLGNIQSLLNMEYDSFPYVGSVYIGTESGFTIFSDADSDVNEAVYDARERAWYQTAKSAGTLIWSDLMLDASGRGAFIACARPYYGSGGLMRGVAGAGMDLSVIREIISSTRVSETGFAFISNERGEIIISDDVYDEAFDTINITTLGEVMPYAAAANILLARSGVTRGEVRGQDCFIAHAPLTSLPWSVVVIIDANEITAPALQSEQRIMGMLDVSEGELDNRILIIGLVAVAAMSAAVLIAFSQTKRTVSVLAEPLKTLTEDAARIGAGDIEHSLNVKTGDEFEILSDAFNSMIDNIKTVAAEKERALYASLREQEANKQKSAFLANMSHEIRTPMNVILGITEILLRDEQLSGSAATALDTVHNSGRLLLNIINDILDHSKIEAGKLEIIPVSYDMPSLINDEVQLCRLQYDAKPINFSVQIDQNTPLNLIGDELRIKQVLNNILSNAFKYTDQGEVRLSVAAADGGEAADSVIIEFCITDTGQGMSREQVDILFNEYTRFNLEQNRTATGTGLGMSITRRILSLMGGDISVKSEPGRGSTFTVRIPQKRADTQVCGAGIAENLSNFQYQNTKGVKKSRKNYAQLSHAKVLVVDDMTSNLLVAQGMLSPYSLNIDTCTSGFAAIDKIKNGTWYDIIFMDHMMPKLDGIETTKKLREMDYKKPIVALTANALSGQAKMFMDNGFDGYLSKPIDSNELDALLKEFIPQGAAAAADGAAGETRAADEKPGSVLKNLPASLQERLKKAVRNDIDKALVVLDDFIAKTDEPIDKDIELYDLTVHGMKSALANYGNAELSQAAAALERAAKSGDLETVKTKTPGFIADLRRFRAGLD